MSKEQIKKFAGNIETSTSIVMWVCIGLTFALGIGSYFYPPPGEISRSVLEFGALIFAFAALLMVREAIKEGRGIKYEHGNTKIEVSGHHSDNAY